MSLIASSISQFKGLVGNSCFLQISLLSHPSKVTCLTGSLECRQLGLQATFGFLQPSFTADTSFMSEQQRGMALWWNPSFPPHLLTSLHPSVVWSSLLPCPTLPAPPRGHGQGCSCPLQQNGYWGAQEDFPGFIISLSATFHPRDPKGEHLQTHTHELYLAALQTLVSAGYVFRARWTVPTMGFRHNPARVRVAGEGRTTQTDPINPEKIDHRWYGSDSLLPEGIRRRQNYIFCFSTGFFLVLLRTPSFSSLSSKGHYFLIKWEGRFGEERENLCSSCPKLISILSAPLFAYLKRSCGLTEGRIAFAF